MIKKAGVTILLLFAYMFAAIAADRKFTLVIDPGHGGRDAGALGAFSKEKDVNLAVSLAFGHYVERNLPDVRVIYTRKTDVFIPLIERANIANRNKADFFISIHTNALPNGKTAYGLETYTLGMHRAGDNLDVAKRENSVILVEKDYKQSYQGFNPNSSESYIMFEFMQDLNMSNSVDMAKMIQKEVCSVANRPDKGVHQAGFLVLRETSMPGCLVELGFITTPEEERLLNDKERIDRIAEGMYKAFLRYRNKYSPNIVIPFKAPASTKMKVKNIVPDEYKQEDSDVRAVTLSPTMVNTPVQTSRQDERNKVEKVVTDTSIPSEHEPAVASDPVISNDKSVILPVFKIQLFVSRHVLKPGNRIFKGLADVDYYEEDNVIKYTYGASANYNEIVRLRKSVLTQFPDAFIIAFKNGHRMDVNQAVREFKVNK